MTDNTNTTDRAIESIVKQWNGGEHVLAGKRASELIYGAGKQPNQAVQDVLTEKAVGIERYLAAPAGPAVTQVSDQSGDPLATQPENREEALHPSNMSTDKAKSESDEIDAKLKPGRDQRTDMNADDNPAGGSTRLNPQGSDADTKNRSKPFGGKGDHDANGRTGGAKKAAKA